jgi:hypothetical protein
MSETQQTQAFLSDARETPLRCRAAYSLVAIVSLLLRAGYCAFRSLRLELATQSSIIEQHAAIVMGMPIAVLLAATLVSGAWANDGPLGLSVLGVELKGGIGALFTWLAIFSAIVLAFRALW